MTYHEGEAVLYKPRNIVAYIKRVNNRPEVSETQRNYIVDVEGFLCYVPVYLEGEYLAPAPPKPRPPVRKPTVLGSIREWFKTDREKSDPGFRTQHP